MSRKNGRNTAQISIPGVPVLASQNTILPEVGEPLHIHLTDGRALTATYLGVVSDGKSLARAMRLMWDIAREREAATGDVCAQTGVTL